MNYGISWLIGYQILARWVDREREEDWLLLFLAPGLGFAITSVFLFIQLVLFGVLNREVVLLIHLLILWIMFRITDTGHARHKKRTFSDKFLFFGLVVLVLALMFACILKSPSGTGIDAWAIWKLKARFLFESDDWRDTFSKILHFSHPDYPLFYPLVIVWGWLGAGQRIFAAPIFVNCFFTLSLAGILASALRDKSEKTSWILALWMVSIPFFIGIGSSQYADILVAYFNLAAVVLMSKALDKKNGRLAFAAGFFGGVSPFVKNEGWLFLLCFFIALLFKLYHGRETKKGRKEVLLAFYGSLPFVFLTLLFKKIAAWPSHILSWEAAQQHAFTSEMSTRLLTIARFFLEQVFNENAWVYAWFLVAVILILFSHRVVDRNVGWMLHVVVLMMLGYAGIYLVTTIPLVRHLTNSIDRVLIHIFPILAYFSFCGEPFITKKLR